ncbi:helix-hairpin-helix domain-containing protein [Glycomyces sp. L485]|uniref:helix-hairpin-helix domain-containing protein n=1 Tax=Glycomyces sp. L485 TaxID=2909235 RepID=UPI001F4A804B|nr:helix-hairpin-helix domain-containing protein [Glycomyces sp. L485]MCH7232586.1 helix-hairpin-helix domain-containing protein [Glycomyces sp. L485]
MDIEDPPETAALAARLRLKLDEADQAQRVCKETVDTASGEVAATPLSDRPARQRLTDRAEQIQARVGLSHINRRVLAAVAIVAAATGLFITVLAWPRSEPVTTAAAQSADTASAQPETIVVSVAGAVKEPGIVELEAGSRVADAIEAAGGLDDGADPGFLNLARVVTDGDLVAIPAEQEAAGAAGGGGPAAGGLVNVNVADTDTLTALPGIGPVLAERIIDHREANGSFQSVEELAEVQGVGPAMLEQLRDHVTL